MGPNLLYRKVHSGLRHGKDLGPIVPVVLVRWAVPVPVPFLCSVNEPFLCLDVFLFLV